MSGLSRFHEAQSPIYDTVLKELRAGRKRSHWMWFVFPQIDGLGSSPTARHFAIRDLDEAREYLADSLLRHRLIECIRAVLRHADRLSAEDIFGPVDAMKFRSSLTLFEAAGGDPVFAQAIETFFDGVRDERTLEFSGSA